VFRRKTSSVTQIIPAETQTVLSTLSGPWDIVFPTAMGAPEKLQMTILESLTLNSNDGVKYFSGTADYIKNFDAPKKWFLPGSRLILDLGKVGDIAEVTLNSMSLGIFWKPPYQVDITNTLKKGENNLEIKVTNQWTNRLIGDQKATTESRVLNSPLRVFAGQKMNDSGLLGPVTILLKQ
jgi:hypothetical protein